MFRFLLVGLIFLSACGSRELSPHTSSEVAFPAQFSSIRDRILIPKCINCHEELSSHKELLQGLVVPGKPASSELYEVISSGFMPPYSDQLLDEEKDAIRVWIEKGALLHD